LVLIVLFSGCIDNGYNANNFTELNNTNNNTYFVAGVSFKCPDNWSAGVDNENGNICSFSSSHSKCF